MDEHFRLGMRFKTSEQPERAAFHFRVVLDRQSDHRAARRALGYRRTRATTGRPDRPARWVRQPSERIRTQNALRRALHDDPAERARGRYLVLALESAERRRALAIVMRSKHELTRTRAVQDLAKHERHYAAKMLLGRLAEVYSAGDAGSYISQSTQLAYIEDFDVEIA